METKKGYTFFSGEGDVDSDLEEDELDFVLFVDEGDNWKGLVYTHAGLSSVF